LRYRLPIADRKGTILVGLRLLGRRHEEVSRDVAQGGENPWVTHAAGGDLRGHHAVSAGKEGILIRLATTPPEIPEDWEEQQDD
jgi:hypothetical protein